MFGRLHQSAILAAVLVVLAGVVGSGCPKPQPISSGSPPATAASTTSVAPLEPPPPPIRSATAKPAPAAADQSTLQGTVEAYFAAAAKPDQAAMLALMTPAWREKAKTWQKGFSYAFVNEGLKVKSWKIREASEEGDTGHVRVKATLVAEGEEDSEGMRFKLIRQDDKWWIDELH